MSLCSDAVIEHEMPMTGASMYWLDALHGCNLDRPLALPYDRYRLVDEQRTGRGISIGFDFGEDLSHAFLAYASANDTTVQGLALACYYTFLFKLTNGERDLCLGINTDGRYRGEFMSVIGMFVNAIPLRHHLDPDLSFHQLLHQVQEIMSTSVRYSYFPLQRILAQHPNIYKPTFLDVSFAFESIDTQHQNNEVTVGDVKLCALPISIKISEDEIMSKFDFILNIQYNVHTNLLSCSINASLDLFDTNTIQDITTRFHHMTSELFLSTSHHYPDRSLCELSIIIPTESILMQSINNTQVHLSSPASCIHHDFASQAMYHPQKLAVELNDQSLTYTELLYYVQQLSLYLLNSLDVVREEIVCQCVERSLSMVNISRRNDCLVECDICAC